MNNLAQRLLIPVTLRSAAASASLIQRSFTTPRPRASSPWTPKKKDDNTTDTPKSLLKVDSSYEKDVLLWRKDLLEAELRLVKEYLERFPVRKAEADEQVNSNINNEDESHDDVVDKDKDDFMSRVASPTREHLRLKKRKAMSKESVLLMEVDKLKEDLGKAELKIKVLEEENERLRQQQQQQHRDATRSFDMSNACSSTSQLPFIPDLPGNTTSSPGKGAINQINQHEKHQHHMMKQQLHSIYRVPSSDQKLSIPQDVFIQRHHSDIGRPIPYYPYSTTTMNTDNYDHHHQQQQQQPQQSQHIHRDRIDWMPPNNDSSSSATRTPEKKISFALSFDANAKGGSSKDSRGYNRCVSNRGRGSRPPLASRWKSR